MALSFPLYRTLTAGQLNLALLFFICLARRQMQRGRPRVAGAVLAFAALYKLMPGIYGLYFLLRRKWKAALTMAAMGLGLLALSTALAGARISLEFLQVLRQMGYGKSTWPEVFSFWDDPPNQSLNSFFTHIFALNDHTTPWLAAGQKAANLVTIAAVGVLFLAYVLTIRPRSSSASAPVSGFTPADDHAWCATLILGLLVPSLLWDHYLVMLILPVAVLLRSAVSLRRPVALIVTLLCYLLICMPWHFDDPRWTAGPGILLMSIKLWPALLLFGLTLCFIRIHRADREATPS
jgi:alpha-1,2-mannosyltransferase